MTDQLRSLTPDRLTLYTRAMKAEIISVGTEILLGEIIDTNAAYVASRLPALGIDVYYKHVVGDNLGRLAETIGRARDNADLVILTGGLGPTEDDLTRESIAAVMGETPAVDAEQLDVLTCAVRAPRPDQHAGAQQEAGLAHPLGPRDHEPARHGARLVGGEGRQDHHRHARPAGGDEPHVGRRGGARSCCAAPPARC